MNERVGDQFADGDLRKQRDCFTKRGANMLCVEQEPIDMIDEPRKTPSVTKLAILAMRYGCRLISPLIGDEPNCLATPPRQTC